MKDLYIAAALHARVADHAAQTSNCAGETESIYPFIGGVVDPDILARTLLFSESTETDGSHRSPLPVQTSRAERKVARNVWDTGRDLRADISGEGMSPQANSRPTAAASPAPQVSSPSITSSPARRGTREASDLANDLLTALRSASPVRMPSSGGKFGSGLRTTSSFQPQAGARAVLDATSAQRIQNQLLSLHEQYCAAFEGATLQVTGLTRPALWLSDLDPLVGTAIAGALDGQIALLHVVRATLLDIPGETARALSNRLSKEQLGYTVATFLRKFYSSPTLEPLDLSLGIVPFGRIALKLASEILVMGTFAHDEALLAAAKRATIEGSSGRIVIDVGDLIVAVSQAGQADVDTTEAVLVLETLIAKNGSVVFIAPSDDVPTRDLDWRVFALKTSHAKLARRNTGTRAKMSALHSLLEDLGEFNMASARMCDVLATASGIPTVPAHRVFQLTEGDAEPNLSAAPLVAAVLPLDAPFDGVDDVFFMSSHGEPGVRCFNPGCELDNRASALVCRCKKFIGQVWVCNLCHLPTLESDANCRQWMCTGTRALNKTHPDSKARTAYLNSYLARLEGARSASGGTVRGGGGGGKGGKGGRGASRE